MLYIVVSYKTCGCLPLMSDFYVIHPQSPKTYDALFLLLEILSESPDVMEFEVRTHTGTVMMPNHFGWAMDKWVEKITYTTEKIK